MKRSDILQRFTCGDVLQEWGSDIWSIWLLQFDFRSQSFILEKVKRETFVFLLFCTLQKVVWPWMIFVSYLILKHYLVTFVIFKFPNTIHYCSKSDALDSISQFAGLSLQLFRLEEDSIGSSFNQRIIDSPQTNLTRPAEPLVTFWVCFHTMFKDQWTRFQK